MANPHLTLFFSSFNAPELVKTVFTAPEYDHPIIGVRTSVAPIDYRPFRWTSMVHALSIFFVRAVIFDEDQRKHCPLLVGEDQSSAVTIASIANRSRENGALDLLGSDRNGRPSILRTFFCINYRRRIAAPVEVYYRSGFLSADNIDVIVAGSTITGDKHKLSKLDAVLTETWKAGKTPAVHKKKKLA